MQITLAKALKEKNRIVGEINKLWTLVSKENSCWETHTRSIDVKETMKTVDFLTEKLIEIKTKIGKANEGILEYMYSLEECKNLMSRFDQLNTMEDIRYRNRGFNNEVMEVCSAEITEKEVIERRRTLQRKCDQLQDEMDAYNATHKIEFDSPLK